MAHVRGDVQRGLGEQPECEDAKNNTEEHAIIAAESRVSGVNYFFGSCCLT